MRAFRYSSARTLDQAVESLAQPGTRVLAGGTDLLNLLKDDVVSAETLLDIKRVPELNRLRATGSGRKRMLEIGAAVTLESLSREIEALDAGALAGLSQAIDGIHSPQIRNMGTLGGDLLQRPRCWYFRAGYGLVPELKGVSMVEAGDHRFHAIFETGEARFVSPSSLAPVLIALDAQVELVASDGARMIPLADLFVVPSEQRPREHSIEADELLTRVLVPMDAKTSSATYEVRHRQTLDWPLATASVAWRERRGKIHSPRVVLGHVASVPWRADRAAQRLEGFKREGLTAAELTARVDEVAELAVASSKPLSGNGYKVQLARTATRRAVQRCLGVEPTEREVRRVRDEKGA